MKKSDKSLWIKGLLMLLLATFLAVGGFSVSQAAGREHHVRSFDDLLGVVAQSQMLDFENQTIYLEEDIEITPIEQAILDKYGIKHLTFGNKDCWFKGTFDGKDHTIKGLEYHKTILPDQNCGLFSYAQNAVIKNLTIEDARLESIYQGGILVGQAKNCTLENITVLNSDLEVIPANNIVSLITNGGFCGGGIVGLMEDSTMYNCEISGTVVHCNITAGVAAVGGEGLYMGGLVGWASNSTIEYCRSRSNYGPDGSIRQSRVKNHYDTAVGALGGKSLYVAGIVGGVNNGCRIYDCFSTADLYFYAANYVSVGSGTAGYGGGIVGALRGGSTVERCHYAGDISSMQYNAILVIPIIQKNVNICGIARLLEDNSQVNNAFYRPSDIVSGAQIPAAGSKDNDLHYPVDDEQYQDVNFWEEKGFDFTGTIDRITNTHNKQAHKNKWVMDYDLGIPVHGNSISASFDFPEAGSVTIQKTMLVNRAVTTEDPLSFAVQGIHPRENQIVSLSAAVKDRYRLTGWYQKEHVTTHEAATVEELLTITEDESLKIQDTALDITVPIQDNDLLVAAIEANVTFHEIDGSIIREDWYRFGDGLKECVVKLPDASGAKFYGWTTMPNSDSSGEQGYSAITSTQLNDILQQNALYQPGDRVERELKLYPVFVNSLTNVLTEFEGHEQDSLDDVTRRELVGHTEVAVDDTGVFIDVKGENPDGSFPEGYRFKGWYQKQPDGQEVKVSRDPRYYIPELTGKVTYVARFTYSVEYLAKAFHQNNGNSFQDSECIAVVWHEYQEGFQDIDGPAYDHENVIGWGEQHVDHGHDFDVSCADRYTAENLKITQPVKVYSHNANTTNGVANNYAVFADTDFPVAGSLESFDVGNLQAEFEFVPTSDRYVYNFWTLERVDDRWTYASQRFNTGNISNTANYKARAMAYTLVDFYDKESNLIKRVNRRYQDTILMESDQIYTYCYPHYHTTEVVEENTYDNGTISSTLIREGSPLDQEMNREGYLFLGWVSDQEVEKDGYEWKYLYDVKDDPYCTSDIEKAKPYLIRETDLVTEAMTLYPVYAKYNITTTTNIHVIANLPADVNKPTVPSYTLNTDGKPFGKAEITVTAESNVTPVLSSKPDGSKYKLSSMTCEYDGVEKKLTLTPSGNGYVYTGEVTAGKSYQFVAYYSPLLLMYHQDDNNTIKTVVRESGEKVGAMPEPDYAKISGVDKLCFVGWTEQKPENGVVHKLANKAEADRLTLIHKSVIVKRNMDLWPVFAAPSATVNSNIDTVITNAGANPEQYRALQKSTGNTMQLNASDYPGYKFTGWYTGYQDEKNPGTLLSENLQQKLTLEQVFAEKTYTAVFKKALQVKYYDTEGTLLHIENVISGERSFVDDAGAALDTEPILALQEKLNENETFNHWQWADQGEMKDWKDFCKDKITRDMDLYPQIIEVGATDAKGMEYSGKLMFRFVQSQAPNPDTPADSYTLAGLFTEDYEQPFLTLAVRQKSWNPMKNSSQISPISKAQTRMYVLREEEGEKKLVEASKGPILTDGQGQARHDFFGKLILKKEYQDQKISDRVWIYLTSQDGTGFSGKVPIDVNKGVGTVTVNLPVGQYTLEEDRVWNWRDSATFDGGDDQGSYHVVMGGEQTVTIQNIRSDKKWFTGEDSVKNKMNGGGRNHEETQ